MAGDCYHFQPNPWRIIASIQNADRCTHGQTHALTFSAMWAGSGGFVAPAPLPKPRRLSGITSLPRLRRHGWKSAAFRLASLFRVQREAHPSKDDLNLSVPASTGVSDLPPTVGVLQVEPHDRWSFPVARGGSIRIIVGVVALAHLLPLLSPIGRDKRAGDDTRFIEGITVELIESSEVDRRLPSPDMARSESTLTPSPPAPPPASPAMQSSPSPSPPATPPSNMPVADMDKLLSTSLPSAFDVPPTEKPLALGPPPTFSNQLPALANPTQRESPAERYLERRSKTPRAATGEVDAFTTAVARALERVKPVSHGGGGRLMIAFVVTPSGRMEELRLVESSGSKSLDELVMRAAIKATLPVPPITASLRDRTFEIAYNYR